MFSPSIRELKTLVEGDGGASYKHGDPGSEHHDAFIAIQALRQRLGMASADVQNTLARCNSQVRASLVLPERIAGAS
jgi:hypothetical protein